VDGTERDKWGHTAADRERIHREYLESLEAAGVDPDAPPRPTRTEQALAKAEGERDAERFGRSWDAFEHAVEDGDLYEPGALAEELARLRQLGGDEAVELALHYSHEAGLIDLDDDEEMGELLADVQEVEQQARAESISAHAAMAQVLEERRLDEIARTAAAAHEIAATSYFAERGIARSEALVRLQDAHIVAAEYGVNMEVLPPDQYAEALAHYDGEARAMISKAREHLFHQRLMAEETTSVADGLTTISPLTGEEIPMSGVRRPQPQRVTQADIGRQASAVSRRRGIFAPGEGLAIRQALTEPDPKAGGKDGWEAIQEHADGLFKAAEPDPRR
jgi:hypothetical protein